MRNFQEGTWAWLIECFGRTLANHQAERNYRFLEEALELVQALGCTKAEALRIVDYTFDRPAGEPKQEVGGTLISLAALCTANDIDMHAAAKIELMRCWDNIAKIREKHRNKPQSVVGPRRIP